MIWKTRGNITLDLQCIIIYIAFLLQYRNAILIACNNHTTTNLLPASDLSYPNHEHLWSNEVKNKTRFIFLRSTYVLIKVFHFYVWKILPLIQLMKLSTAMTLKSSRRSCKMQWLAIYPPPPVTKIVFPGMIQTLGWKYKYKINDFTCFFFNWLIFCGYSVGTSTY